MDYTERSRSSAVIRVGKGAYPFKESDIVIQSRLGSPGFDEPPAIKRTIMRTEEKRNFLRKAGGLWLFNLGRLGKGRGLRSLLIDAVLHPYFPITFLLRNIETVSKEPSLIGAPLLVRRVALQRLVFERALIFLSVKRWMQEKGTYGALQAGISNLEENSSGSYCNHCGRCCEIASGFPDFPPQSAEIPVEWLKIFGDGLGRGHRFCAFMWEANGSGRSFCSIHHWRSNPCRIFEEDECDYLKKDPAFPGPSTLVELKGAYRSMLHLINGG